MKIKNQVKCELAKREFFEYCKLLYPQFYKKNRGYLKKVCDSLQEFYYNDDEFMIVNAPPRHGKSFTATNFAEWVFGINPLEKIMSGSYNEDLSKNFSKKVRNTITTEKIAEDNIVYNDIFPGTVLKFGSAEAKKWQIEKSNEINYLATSPTGTATGFGATLLIIDDLIKNGEEANNSTVLEKQWEWFTNTMLSRREGKKKVLIIMTRWSSKDLAGRILSYIIEKGYSYKHINFKAYNEDTGAMLCEDIFNYEDYIKAKDIMGEDIFSANYQQIPIDLKGVLYSNFLEYEELPKDQEGNLYYKSIENYTDTADQGNDYLASFTYAVGFDNKAYILDILYTKDPMEVTEPLLAKKLLEYKVNYCYIESNNGGRGFSRNVERITRELGNRNTIFKPFHQTQNKTARILTNATGVMNNIMFPKGWKVKHREAYDHLKAYQREGTNKHDDIEDAITGVNERLQKNNKRGWN